MLSDRGSPHQASRRQPVCEQRPPLYTGPSCVRAAAAAAPVRVLLSSLLTEAGPWCGAPRAAACDNVVCWPMAFLGGRRTLW